MNASSVLTIVTIIVVTYFIYKINKKMYSSEIEETISENKSDTNKPVNKKEERRKTIDFEKIYNAS